MKSWSSQTGPGDGTASFLSDSKCCGQKKLLSHSVFSSTCASCPRCGRVLAWPVKQPLLSQELEPVSGTRGVGHFNSCQVKAVSALSRPTRAMARRAKGSALTCMGWFWLVRSPQKRNPRAEEFPILVAAVGGVFAGWISPCSFQTDQVCEMVRRS